MQQKNSYEFEKLTLQRYSLQPTTTVDVLLFVLFYMYCFSSLQVQFLACCLKHFDVGVYDERCRLMSCWELNLMSCRPTRHYPACFPSLRTLYNCVSMYLPSRYWPLSHTHAQHVPSVLWNHGKGRFKIVTVLILYLHWVVVERCSRVRAA